MTSLDAVDRIGIALGLMLLVLSGCATPRGEELYWKGFIAGMRSASVASSDSAYQNISEAE